MATNERSPRLPRPADAADEELDAALEAQVAELLAKYDELLEIGDRQSLAGTDGVPSQHAPDAVAAELPNLAACLHLLEHVWPRSSEETLPPALPHPPEGDRRPSPCPLPEGEGTGPLTAGEGTGPLTAGEGHAANECTRTLGPFEIMRELGRGGGGIVFLANDTRLGRLVALKVPYPEVLVRRELRQRFVVEARAAAKLNHPHIVSVYETGEIGAICFIASQYCAGSTLAAWLQRLKTHNEVVPIRTAAQLVAELADAVDHAHAHGILHRDIKPSNVLLEWRGASGEEREAKSKGQGVVDGMGSRPHALSSWLPASCPVPKLTDFGLAKVLESERGATRSRAILGTPAYMAPEQAEGRLADIGAATDVYSLGVVLYELIAGRPPFRGDSDLAVLQAITGDDPPPLKRFRKHTPPDLEAICLKCLEKSAARRYQRAADLAADLRRYLNGQPTAARSLSWSGRAAKCVRRRPAVTSLIAVVVVSSVAAVGSLSWYRKQIRHIESTATERIDTRDKVERERTRRYDYANNIQAAHQAWQSTDLSAAIALLEHCRPGPGEEDLRGWEWYYVRRLCAGGLVTLRGHVGAATGAAFAPDGLRLASTGEDGTLRIWDVAGGSLLAAVPAHQGYANAVAWSADGRWIATAGDDARVCLWDAATHEMQTVVVGSTGKHYCVAFSPDSRYVAAAGTEQVIRIWDVTSGEVFRTIEGHTDAVRSVAFHPDGTQIASGSRDRTVHIWSILLPGEPLAVLEPEAPVECVAYSPDGHTLVTVDSQITLWELSDRRIKLRMSGHQGDVFSVAVAPDGRSVASGSNDETVKTWNITASTEDRHDARLNQRNVVHTFRGHSNVVSYVTFSTQGTRLASVGRDGLIQIWDPATPQERQPLLVAPPNSGTCGIAFAPKDLTLVVARQFDNHSELSIWHSLADEPTITIPLPGRVICPTSLSFSPDGHRLALADTTEHVVLQCDCALGDVRVIVSRNDDTGGTVFCNFANDGQRLAVATENWNSARIVDAATGELLARIPGQRVVAFSPDARLLATESSDRREFYPVELWDIAAGNSATRLVGHTGQIHSIVFSAEGRTLATSSSDGTARLWNLDTLTEQFVLRGHRGGITKVVFLLGEKSLATASSDGTVRIWQAATGRELLNLDVVSNPLSGMAVSPDGRTLATAGNNMDGSIRIDLWTAPAENGASEVSQ